MGPIIYFKMHLERKKEEQENKNIEPDVENKKQTEEASEK